MSRIFISYSRIDEPFARKLARSLSEMGADVWLDVEDIPAGMKWSTAIQQGLNVCQIMLLIVSPESMASNNVEDEWQYYLDKQKPIIPLLYRPADKHFQLNRLQHVDFHNSLYHTAFERLLRELAAKGVALQLTEAPRIEFPPAVPPKPAEPSDLLSHKSDGLSFHVSHANYKLDHTCIMVNVPSGKFLMGSTSHQIDKVFAEAQQYDQNTTREWFERECPQHEVKISNGFWLDYEPVSNIAYQMFIDAGGYENADWWTGAGWKWLKRSNRFQPHNYQNFMGVLQPRVGVTWFEAYAYCKWRGGRLPTEAEWEWAFRGPASLIYPWGNIFDAKKIKKEKFTSKHLIKAPIAFDVSKSWSGVKHTSGTIWEWVNTSYKGYPYFAEDGREEINQKSELRVLRGGSWGKNLKVELRNSYREKDFPDTEYGNFGFRCAHTYQPGDV